MRTLRILIVDDDATIAALLAETLVDQGHVVCGIAATEADAVRTADRERPDMIIVDAVLDGGSGVRVMERILRAGPAAHVFISGNRMPAGYHALLKPFRLAELLGAMDRALAAAGHPSPP